VKTLRDCRALLQRHQGKHGRVTALIVSHAHGDHLSGQALRVLADEGIPIQCHRKVLPHLRARHRGGAGSGSPIQAFPDDVFAVGDFRIAAVPLSHAPDVPTFGFVIRQGTGHARRKIVIATDFHDPSNLLPHLHGADFVFVEANHDPQLLSENFNPNSRWHLSNGKTAGLLVQAARGAARPPRNVVLGHLSEKRNRDALAVQAVRREFARQGARVPFELETAPKFEASRIIAIGEGLHESAARQGRLF